MKRTDAESYAKALQDYLGDENTEYTAIQSHKEQTWVVRMYETYGEYHKETLFTTEANLIHFLIGYAGPMKRFSK